MTSALVLLLVAAEPAAAALLRRLEGFGFALQPTRVASADDLAAALAAGPWDAVLAQDDLPGLPLEALLASVRGAAPGLPVIVLAHQANLDAARRVVSAGAHDVLWPEHLDRLPLALEQARQTAEARLYRQTFEGQAAPQLLLDPGTGAIVDANRAAAELYGWAAGEQRPNTLLELDLRAAEVMLAELDEAAAGGMPRQLRWRHQAARGQLRDVEAHTSPIDRPGGRLLHAVLYDVTERVEREQVLEAQARLTAALRAAATRADMFPILLTQARELLQVPAAAIILRDPYTGESVIEQAHGWVHPAGSRLPPGHGIAGRVVSSGPVYWSETEALDGLPAPEAAAAAAAGLQSVAGTPLAAQDQIVGALCVGAGGPLSLQQRRLLEAIGELGASAILRATLHEQTEQRLQRLSALHAIDLAITTSFDLRVTLNVFLDHVVRQLSVDAATVLLLNPSTQMLEFVAVRGLSNALLRSAPQRVGDSIPGLAVLQRGAVYLPGLREAARRSAPYPPGGEVFASYYSVPLLAKGRVLGVLEVLARTRLRLDPDWVDYLEALATQAAIAVDNTTLFNDLQRSNVELNLAYDATIEGWARVLEARGIESHGHTRRVAEEAVRLARAAGLPEPELVNVRRGALLHDIGMLGLPEEVLLKPGPLDEAERALVRRHPEYGFDILAPINYLRPALDIPYAHHERWNGSGYPRGLRGEQIPLAARLFAIVDVWDALRSDRPYRPAWPLPDARAYLHEHAGVEFDPGLVGLFLQNGHA